MKRKTYITSTTRIECKECRNNGRIEIQGTDTASPVMYLFKYFGSDPYTGEFYFRCPSCGADRAIDPTDIIPYYFIPGLSVSRCDVL